MARAVIVLEEGSGGQVKLSCDPPLPTIKELLTVHGESIPNVYKFMMTALVAIADANRKGRQSVERGDKPEIILPPGIVQ